MGNFLTKVPSEVDRERNAAVHSQITRSTPSLQRDPRANNITGRPRTQPKAKIDYQKRKMKSNLLAQAAITLLVAGCTITINTPSPSPPQAGNPSASKQPRTQSSEAPPSKSGIPQHTAPFNQGPATVYQVSESTPPGLKIANATLIYNDGDVLSGDFRIYCPTSMIRPTNYILKDSQGTIKKQGQWWEPAFQPKWEAEHELVNYTCRT